MKIELLAPAGDLYKAKIALMYGADAVYVGGKKFSLRARASNFDLNDILELVNFAHERGKKVYITLNIIPHENDLDDLDEYIIYLDNIGVDAVIASSMYIISRVVRLAKNMKAHLSTQKSLTNSRAIKYYKSKGITRIVLARECTMDEIKNLSNNSSLELEVFIHGGMCASFSGHCVLSNHMTNRDANRGGCAHSCRWNYSLVKNGEKLEQTFNIASKDLMAAPFIEGLIKTNVASLKIEGRLKSAYYLACVIKGYRMLIDRIYSNKDVDEEFLEKVINQIKLGENRITSIGFFNGLTSVSEQLYDNRSEIPTQEYIAFVLDYDKANKRALVEQRNYFKIGDNIAIMTPSDEFNSKVNQMIDFETNEVIDVAPHPLQKIWIDLEKEVKYGDMIRITK